MHILIMLHFQLSYDDINVNLKNGKLGNDNSDRDHLKSIIDVRLMALSNISNARHVQKEKEPFLIDRKYKVGER